MPRTLPNLPLVLVDSTDDKGLVTSARVPSATNLDTTTNIYAVGCLIVDQSTGNFYRNTGTVAAPVWTQTAGALLQQYAEIDISAANITDTAAGHLGHANGYILVPQAPVGFVNVLDQCTLSYTFATAAFTGGGNVTVNHGAGGSAITGLVSAANSIGKASSNVNTFVPLAATATGLTSNASINLVAASAFTQPGTAAGTIKAHVWWTVVPV